MAKPLALTINIDGASRGNPGPAAYAFVISHDGEPILEESGCLGTATNNVAEYTALIKALEKAAELKATSVLIRSDSELLVKQMRGEYKVKNESLQSLHQEAHHLSRRFESVRYSHVPREQNREADRLCNETLNAAGAKSGPTHAAKKTRPKLFETSNQTPDWDETLSEAERILSNAAKSWAEAGTDKPTPRHVLNEIITVLKSRRAGLR